MGNKTSKGGHHHDGTDKMDHSGMKREGRERRRSSGPTGTPVQTLSPATPRKQNDTDEVPKSPRDQRARNRRHSFLNGMSRNIRTLYEIDPKEIGHGHYGVVRKARCIETKEFVAIKTIRKNKVSNIETLYNEIKILEVLDHPNIINLQDVFEDEKYIHLVTELCSGGEMFDRIIEKTNSDEGHYSEKEVAILMQKIFDGINYCHTVHNICHRDLKPENFLFVDKSETADLKIIDFGLSKVGNEDTGKNDMTTRVGTPYYIAPEVLGKKYSNSCDLWSCGVIMYILLCGYPPFYGDNDTEIFRSVRRGKFKFESPEWDPISDEAKALINKLLQLDPDDRPTAAASLKDPWFSKVLDESAVMAPLKLLVKDSLMKFVGMIRLKRIALNVIAEQLTEHEIGELKDMFKAIDKDGNGNISIDELNDAIATGSLAFISDTIGANLEDLMAGMDLDGNNSIDYNEFLAATMHRNIAIKEDNIRRAFRTFDTDSKGYLTLQDLYEIMGSEEHAREVMGDVDLDGNGEISYEEFTIMMKEKHGVEK